VVRGAQRTDASIQSTMAVDLKELQGFFMVGMGGHTPGGFKGPRAFALKHQNIQDVAADVGRQAPSVASSVLSDLRPKSLIPSHLVGLWTLIAQYLLMGASFESPGFPELDKNAVALLSRTDLAKIYKMNVPASEQKVAKDNLRAMRASLLRHTERSENDLLLTPAKRPPSPQATRTITCGAFIDNIFTQDSDGFTPHLDEGLFKQMGPEVIPGRQGAGQATRTAPVFELRNMIPQAGDRFPKDQWVPLTTDLVTLLNDLNTRGFWNVALSSRS
jgi:hypothetical protein